MLKWRWTRGRHRPIKTKLPTPPDGWHLIAPADAMPGDGALLPDGSIQILGIRRFEPIPVEVRRQSWAVRPTEPTTYPLPLVETWEQARGWYTPPTWWEARRRRRQ